MASSKVVWKNGQKSTLYPNGDVKVGGHVNWRNNNPGNIEGKSGWASNHGSIGHDGRFAVFNSMEDGYKAQRDLLHDGVNYRDLSMNEAIHRYAPKADHNDPVKYVAYIKKNAGLDPNKKMKDMTPDEMERMTKTMSKFEGMKSGDVLEGATIAGNQVSGGTKVDDPYATGREGGGTPGSGGAYEDPCDPDGTEEKDTTDKVAQTEGDGKYVTDGASIGEVDYYTGPQGRYQIDQNTAVGLLIEMGIVSSTEEGKELWNRCGNSGEADCTKLQDVIAGYQTTSLKEAGNGLVQDRNRYSQLYLRWNMGVTGSNRILEIHKESGQVTDIDRIRFMDDQEWCLDNPSNGNTKIFFDNLDGFIAKKGVNTNAKI